jgi:hypothetical protein
MSIRNTWKITTILGVILGIIASVISIWTFARIDRLSDLIEKARSWKLKLQIIEPIDGYQTSEKVLRVIGHVNFQATAVDSQSVSKVNLLLHQNEIDIVCYVRPMSKNEVWYLQQPPIIDQNGHFECLVFLESSTHEFSINHQLVVLAVPRGQIPTGNRHPSLPLYYAPSNVILVKTTAGVNPFVGDKNVQK